MYILADIGFFSILISYLKNMYTLIILINLHSFNFFLNYFNKIV